jgi:hypothetical protein
MQLYPTSLHLPWLDVDEEKSVTGDKTVVCWWKRSRKHCNHSVMQPTAINSAV